MMRIFKSFCLGFLLLSTTPVFAQQNKYEWKLAKANGYMY